MKESRVFLQCSVPPKRCLRPVRSAIPSPATFLSAATFSGVIEFLMVWVLIVCPSACAVVSQFVLFLGERIRFLLLTWSGVKEADAINSFWFESSCSTLTSMKSSTSSVKKKKKTQQPPSSGGSVLGFVRYSRWISSFSRFHNGYMGHSLRSGMVRHERTCCGVRV